MKVHPEVPFFANTPDNTHCFQAAIRMVLKYFEPHKDYSWAELDEISAKAEGRWTWPSAGFLWMQDHGYELHNVELFDYQRLSEEGGAYLIDEFGDEVGREQIAHSDMKNEGRLAREFLARGKIERREPQLAEIEDYLDRGWLVVANVNSHVLRGQKGFSGHFVVVIGYDEDRIKLHDPGLPAQEGRWVSRDLFEKAWAYPNLKAKNYAALRPRRPGK